MSQILHKLEDVDAQLNFVIFNDIHIEKYWNEMIQNIFLICS